MFWAKIHFLLFKWSVWNFWVIFLHFESHLGAVNKSLKSIRRPGVKLSLLALRYRGGYLTSASFIHCRVTSHPKSECLKTTVYNISWVYGLTRRLFCSFILLAGVIHGEALSWGFAWCVSLFLHVASPSTHLVFTWPLLGSFLTLIAG